MRNTKVLKCGLCSVIFMSFLFLSLPSLSLAQTNPCAPKGKKASQNPCAANPCAPKAQKAAKNPCAANPCAANPCAPGGGAAVASGKAITVRGEVVKVDPSSKKLVLKAENKQIDLALGKYSVVREGPKVKTLKEVKPGEKVTVSYVETGKERTAWYVYLASAAQGANPCAIKNPCASKQPCAANPCAAKNPCAVKNPCSPKATKASKNPCATNPCAVKQPCAPEAGKKK